MKTTMLMICLLFLMGCTSEVQDQKNQDEKAKLFSKRTLTGKTAASIRKDDCSKSAKAAAKAHKYAKRAQNSGNFEAIRDNAKDAMEAFEDSRKYSDKCGCRKAEKVAGHGYQNASKAYRSGNIEEAQAYARSAKKIADDLVSAANSCSYN